MRARRVRLLFTGVLFATLAAACSGSDWSHAPSTSALCMTAPAAVLLVVVLPESHRRASRDGLTGLPTRRALEE